MPESQRATLDGMPQDLHPAVLDWARRELGKSGKVVDENEVISIRLAQDSANPFIISVYSKRAAITVEREELLDVLNAIAHIASA